MAEAGRGCWRKGGLIFRPEGQGGWMHSHAQVPTAIMLSDRIRVYFASRPRQDLSLTGYVDLDPQRPERILALSERPILDVGAPGAFDEHGIMPAAAVKAGEAIRLYYTGWSRLAGTAPYHNTTGVAISEDAGLTFRRFVMGPVLDRTPEEPFSATLPNVICVADTWHARCASGLGWLDIGGHLEHVYDLRHATWDEACIHLAANWRGHRRASPSRGSDHPAHVSLSAQWRMVDVVLLSHKPRLSVRCERLPHRLRDLV